MKKEMILAIGLGLVLGLIVTYGIYTARQSFTDTTGITTEATIQPSAEAVSSMHNTITLISPEDESVQNTPEVKIIGTTDPNAQVVIMINAKPFTLESDASGNFSIQDNLGMGANFINVRAVDEDGNIASIDRTVTYTTIDFDEPLPATASGAPTASASSKTATSSPKAR